MKPPDISFLKSPVWIRKFVLAVVLALQFLVLPRGLTLDVAKTLSQFNCRNWTRQNGLPVDKINCVAQSRDGYLWLGTEEGLVRFDGLEFQTMAVELSSGQGHDIRNLTACKDGKIIFSVNNGGFGCYNGTNLSAMGGEGWSEAGMEVDASAIMEARNGMLWAATAKSVARWSVANRAGSFIDATNTGLVISFCEDAAGGIWLGTAGDGLYFWAEEKLNPIRDETLEKLNIFALAADSTGQIWIGTDHGLKQWAHGQVVNVPEFNWEIKALLVDRQGALWLGTSGAGLARYEKGKFTFFRKADGLCSDYVTSLLEDTEGSLWVGTRDGLSQLSDVKFPVYSINEGIGDGTGHSVAASKNGGLWIGTGLGLCYFDGSAATNYAAESLFSNPYIKLCFEARNGDVYVEDGERNIEILSGGRLLSRLTNSAWTSAIAEDAQSVLIAAGSGDCLYRFQKGKLNHYQYKDGVPPDYYWINNLFIASDGAIWVASKNGIFRLQNGAIQHWSTANGLSSDNVLWVCQDAEGSIWVGLASGIARIKDGLIKNIKPENGLADSCIYAIVPDDCGWVWFSSSRGIFRIRRTALDDFANGKIERIESEMFNGLNVVKSTGRTEQENSACKTLDGRIWFPCPWGVVMIDPAHIPVNRVAPPVHITRVLANGKLFPTADTIIVPTGRGDLQFDFTGLSFIAPESIQFRYQLEGYDSGAETAKGRRQVFYTHLKPGRYRFHVTAADADGVWNQTGDSLNIILRPHFQQTTGFYCLCGGLVLALLGAVYAWRFRHLRAKQRELQESARRLEEEVRKRTAELADRTQSLEKEVEERKRMQLEIERVHHQLLETSRQAGMAEVAASVLHNVGNVLNSVNVSATLISGQLKQSHLPALGKVAALVNEHADDLAGFLTADPKGRRLPSYLNQLSEQLVREQQNGLMELDLLCQNIEHIKDIVAMQQNYGKISGVTETVQIADLVEDALRIHAGTLARHGIELARDYAELPPIEVEKHKALQILVNLIANGWHACDEAGRNDKRLKITISRAAHGIQISVSDNGIGIPQDNLKRIFNFGFTTRKEGHGFALHSGAIAATEMGGLLTALSEGPGQGATFTLTLPLQPPNIGL